MIVYFGSRFGSSVIAAGSAVTEEHLFAQLQAIGCHAKGTPIVYFLEVEPENIRFVDEIGYLRYNTKPIAWHRVGR
jgi:hypothetical protein